MDGPPTPEHLEAFAAMDRFTEELVKAGVSLPAPASRTAPRPSASSSMAPAARSSTGRSQSRELVARFSIGEVKDMDEALAWAKRAPDLMAGKKSEMEIRRFYEAADLAEFITRDYAPLPAARGDFLFRAGRLAEARLEFKAAATLTRNVRKGPFCSHGRTTATASTESCFGGGVPQVSIRHVLMAGHPLSLRADISNNQIFARTSGMPKSHVFSNPRGGMPLDRVG